MDISSETLEKEGAEFLFVPWLNSTIGKKLEKRIGLEQRCMWHLRSASETIPLSPLPFRVYLRGNPRSNSGHRPRRGEAPGGYSGGVELGLPGGAVPAPRGQLGCRARGLPMHTCRKNQLVQEVLTT